MKFDLYTANYVFPNLSRTTFLEMLLVALKNKNDLNMQDSVDGYTLEYARWWHFPDLNMDFACCASSSEEIEDFMEEIRR